MVRRWGFFQKRPEADEAAEKWRRVSEALLLPVIADLNARGTTKLKLKHAYDRRSDSNEITSAFKLVKGGFAGSVAGRFYICRYPTVYHYSSAAFVAGSKTVFWLPNPTPDVVKSALVKARGILDFVP